MTVFVGTGVGGGLIVDDRLVTGDRGMAAEIGHVTVVPGGRPCGCGGQGHLETYAGRAGIDRRERGRRICRPDSVHRQAGVTVIPLDKRLPECSSHLPAYSSGPPDTASRTYAYLVLLRMGFCMPSLSPGMR